MNRWGIRGLCWVLILLLVGGFLSSGAAREQAAPPSSSRDSNEREAIGRFVDLYCVACHNRDDKTAGLALDAIGSEDVSRNANAWEKVVRKLVARQMPPAEEVRPSRRTYDAFVSLLAGVARPRGRRSTRPRPDRHVPAAQPDRVPERHPRPPGARHRRDGAAAEGRVEPWVRQRDGGRPLADAPGPLHHRGAEDQPAGRRAARAGRPAATRSASGRTSPRKSTSRGCRSARAAGR